MITYSALSLSFMLMWMLKSMNPIKVSVSVLLSSCMMFFLMGVSSSMTWFSIVLLMLFMGGIILMFMILSSILPNEKSVKSKHIMTIMSTLFLMSMCTPLLSSEESTAMNMKAFLISGLNFFLMMSIILFYFMGSMSILSSEQSPMRTLICHQSLIL